MKTAVVTLALCGVMFFGSFAGGQETDSSSGDDADNVPRTESGECFTASDVVDMTVFGDSSIYVETRARHFLLTTGQQCNNLQRAYERNAVGFVPFGRRICPNDGSHLRYETGGRARICPIGRITEVEDRAEARELADLTDRALDDDLVVTEDIEP